MAWDEAAGPLLGVVIGTLGALTGQVLTSRRDDQRMAISRHQEARAERKNAIVQFFSATQQVEMLIDARRRGKSPRAAGIDDRVHEMWLARKLVDLLCSADFSQAADAYCITLQGHVRDVDGTSWSNTKREVRSAALRAARRDLSEV